MCQMQSEAKQTRTSEFGPEKGFIAEPWKEKVWLMLKNTKLPSGLGGKGFTGKLWGESCSMCDFLLIGWWWGSRVVLQECWIQPKVNILYQGRGLSSCRRTQRYPYVYSLRRNQNPALMADYSFLVVSPLFLHSLTPLISNSFCLLFGIQEGLRGWSLCPANKKLGTQKSFCAQEDPTGSCLALLLLLSRFSRVQLYATP